MRNLFTSQQIRNLPRALPPPSGDLDTFTFSSWTWDLLLLSLSLIQTDFGLCGVEILILSILLK